MMFCRMVMICLLATTVLISQPMAATVEVATEGDTLLTEHQKHRKSIVEGMAATVFPGFFVHGIGNFYADSPTSGTIILLTEALGVSLMVIAMSSLDDVTFGDLVRSGASRETEDILGYSAFILFFASWAADIVSTPFLVKKYNSELEEESGGLSLRIVPRCDEHLPVALQVCVTF